MNEFTAQVLSTFLFNRFGADTPIHVDHPIAYTTDNNQTLMFSVKKCGLTISVLTKIEEYYLEEALINALKCCHFIPSTPFSIQAGLLPGNTLSFSIHLENELTTEPNIDKSLQLLLLKMNETIGMEQLT